MRHDLAPRLDQHLAKQPLKMDRNAFEKMTRGKLKPEARIDLHGMTLAEAHAELIGFILGAHAAGKRLVLVITGKGKIRDDHGPIPQRMGALRNQVPHWLAAPPLGSAILQITPASLRHGGEGAYYVYLKRQR
jgi:DNA-nicking Smr family endonuclease